MIASSSKFAQMLVGFFDFGRFLATKDFNFHACTVGKFVQALP